MAEEKVKKDLNKNEVRAVLHGEHEHNSRGRGRSPAEIRESYARYYEMKKKVAELEMRNFQHLVLWPASDKDTNEKRFYNMGGHSAVIYVYEIAPRLKRKAHLRIDMDNGETKFKTGICSILEVESLEKALKEIGIKRLTKIAKGYEDCIIFKLAREYSKAEIKEMMRQEQRNMDQLNKVLFSKVVYPDIHKQILELKKMVPAKVKNMDKTYRVIVGMKMIDTLFDIVRLYSEMAHGDRDEYEAAVQINREADMLLAEISIMTELKLWDLSISLRLGDVTVGLKKLLKAKIINKYEVN